MKNHTVYNNKQNQLPEKLHLDTKVEGWAVWFCLRPLPARLLIYVNPL